MKSVRPCSSRMLQSARDRKRSGAVAESAFRESRSGPASQTTDPSACARTPVGPARRAVTLPSRLWLEISHPYLSMLADYGRTIYFGGKITGGNSGTDQNFPQEDTVKTWAIVLLLLLSPVLYAQQSVNTRIKESQNIQFRVEMYNATNTRNFGIPEGRVNSSNFLNQWGTDGGNRRIIVALRYTF